MARLRAIAVAVCSTIILGANAAKDVKLVKLGDKVTLRVDQNDWNLEIVHDKGVIKTANAPRGRIGYGLWVGTDITDKIYEGYSWRAGVVVDWWHATKVKEFRQVDVHSAFFRLSTSDPLGGVIDVTATAAPEGDVVTLSIKAHGGAARRANRLGAAFEAGPEEGYYGFGERFVGSTNNKGKDLYCWTEDGGWVFGSKARLPKERSTYTPIPFMLSSRGYGVFVNSSYRSNWRLDSLGLRKDLDMQNNTNLSAYAFEVETLSSSVSFILGDTPAQTLSLFTGPNFFPSRSLVPPKYQFGPWNQFSNEFNDTGYHAAIKRFAQLDIPSSVAIDPVHFFPLGDEKGQEGRVLASNTMVRSYGLVPLAYFNSMLDEKFLPEYADCAAQDMFLKLQDGSIYSFVYKGAGSNPFRASLLDFTNPKASAWFQGRMQKALDLGFGGFMYDYGEYVSPNALAYDKTKGDELHNAYPLQYQKVAYDFFMAQDTNASDAFAPEFLYYVRSGYSGSQSVIWAHWTGDPYSGWDTDSGLGAQVKAQLSLGLSGVPFSGSDIGGFVWEDPPTPELWIRWTQVGAFSGMMHTQMGGTPLLHTPKSHIHDTAEGSFIYRKFAKLRTALFPYLYTAALEAHTCGLPLMRHHLLSFPHDPIAHQQDYQFLFGPSLLVAPVILPGLRALAVYLPSSSLSEGDKVQQWVDVSSHWVYDKEDGRLRIGSPDRFHAGGQDVRVQADLATVPCFVKAGSILVTLDPSVDTLNDASHEGVTSLKARSMFLHLWVWPDATGAAASGLQWDGSTFTLHPAPEASGLIFTASDPVPGRVLIAQLALDRALNVDRVVDRESGRELQRAEGWRQLVGVEEGGPSAFALDEAQGTLWVRMPAPTRSVRIDTSATAAKTLRRAV